VNFIVPKDIDYRSGPGKISYYARSGSEDANGESGIIVGGSQGSSSDQKGPDIAGFLNTEDFRDGGATGSKPLLILKLADSSGINITGSAIGHDITVMIDSLPQKTLVLNNLFTPVLNSYRQGSIRVQLPELAKGRHSLKIKAWDVANNSSEMLVNFTVTDDFSVFETYAFPNPFVAGTTIRFTHNLDAQKLSINTEIFTLSGLHVKSLISTINTSGSRSCDLVWDGKNDSGVPVPGGYYVYRLTITSEYEMIRTKSGRMLKRWNQ